MYKYLLLILLLASCSPVKQVLRSPEKTLVVVDAYLKRYPIASDTQYVKVPGDSVVSIIINTDTAYSVDTLHVPIERVITKYITRTITKTDTLVKTIIDKTFQTTLQQQVFARDVTIDQLKQDKADLLASRNKFRLWLWLLSAAVGGGGLLWLYIRFKA